MNFSALPVSVPGPSEGRPSPQSEGGQPHSPWSFSLSMDQALAAHREPAGFAGASGNPAGKSLPASEASDRDTEDGETRDKESAAANASAGYVIEGNSGAERVTAVKVVSPEAEKAVAARGGGTKEAQAVEEERPAVPRGEQGSARHEVIPTSRDDRPAKSVYPPLPVENSAAERPGQKPLRSPALPTESNPGQASKILAESPRKMRPHSDPVSIKTPGSSHSLATPTRHSVPTDCPAGARTPSASTVPGANNGVELHQAELEPPLKIRRVASGPCIEILGRREAISSAELRSALNNARRLVIVTEKGATREFRAAPNSPENPSATAGRDPNGEGRPIPGENRPRTPHPATERSADPPNNTSPKTSVSPQHTGENPDSRQSRRKIFKEPANNAADPRPFPGSRAAKSGNSTTEKGTFPAGGREKSPNSAFGTPVASTSSRMNAPAPTKTGNVSPDGEAEFVVRGVRGAGESAPVSVMESTLPAGGAPSLPDPATISRAAARGEMPPAPSAPPEDAWSAASERLSQLIVRESAMIRRTGAESMAVTIKPDAETALVMHLSRSDGHLEARVHLERGDFGGLNQHWGNLQDHLARQNIRLAPLADAFQPDAGGTASQPGTGGHDHRGSEDSAPGSATPSRGPSFSPEKSVSNHPHPNSAVPVGDGWESWA